ncbi:uncharacterized protein LOC135208103 [Macrobrachium nipponense]|uniref:uncharacterized protein LOC135208103 n=1 Tax=Macrobrachium nipponense TaxID=159736 RepID=UPI0030C81CB2
MEREQDASLGVFEMTASQLQIKLKVSCIDMSTKLKISGGLEAKLNISSVWRTGDHFNSCIHIRQQQIFDERLKWKEINVTLSPPAAAEPVRLPPDLQFLFPVPISRVSPAKHQSSTVHIPTSGSTSLPPHPTPTSHALPQPHHPIPHVPTSHLSSHPTPDSTIHPHLTPCSPHTLTPPHTTLHIPHPPFPTLFQPIHPITPYPAPHATPCYTPYPHPTPYQLVLRTKQSQSDEARDAAVADRPPPPPPPPPPPVNISHSSAVYYSFLLLLCLPLTHPGI